MTPSYHSSHPFPQVYLVGAGPGEKGLITYKGLQALQKAQVVFYDNLVNPEILEWTSTECQKIYVGKRGYGTCTDQDKIEDLMVAAARQGKRIVRLKGGDPVIFGRGGEEAERLVQEGIPFEIVPGITSAIAAPLYAGIPLTHRDFTSTVTFVTGHGQKPTDDSKSEEKIDWKALAQMRTLVFLMGVKTIRSNMENLMQAGLSSETPVALIRWGTYPKQQTWVSNVGSIAKVVEKQSIMPPCVLVVGEVVKLREKLQWFESKPLFGKRLVVTRARKQASELSENLRQLGAEVIEIPAIEIVPTSSWSALDKALKHYVDYAWMVFTSVNAVDIFFQRLRTLSIDLRKFAACKIAVVGNATAERLKYHHLYADLIPNTFDSDHLAQVLLAQKPQGKILVLQAQEGKTDWQETLIQQGLQIDRISLYENQKPELSEFYRQPFNPETLDLLTFASSSSVKNFLAYLEAEKKNDFLKVPAVCIGPTTLQTALECGFQNLHQANQATIEGMIEKVRDYFA